MISIFEPLKTFPLKVWIFLKFNAGEKIQDEPVKISHVEIFCNLWNIHVTQDRLNVPQIMK